MNYLEILKNFKLHTNKIDLELKEYVKSEIHNLADFKKLAFMCQYKVGSYSAKFNTQSLVKVIKSGLVEIYYDSHYTYYLNTTTGKIELYNGTEIKNYYKLFMNMLGDSQNNKYGLFIKKIKSDYQKVANLVLPNSAFDRTLTKRKANLFTLTKFAEALIFKAKKYNIDFAVVDFIKYCSGNQIFESQREFITEDWWKEVKINTTVQTAKKALLGKL